MINGDRVRQVRELRGLTQKDLATSIDITQPFIAQIETGFAQPSEEVLAALSQQTGFPTAFFRQEPPVDFPLGSLLFRARAGTTAGERWKAYRYAQLLFELYQKLGSRLSDVDVNVPRLVGTPAEPLYPADAARISMALALSPDTSLDSLIRELERKGVIILGLPIALTGIDAFAVWAGANKSRPVIVLSADAPGDRQRFSVAHELGHLVMHHAPEGTVSSVEREADQFAAEFYSQRSQCELRSSARNTHGLGATESPLEGLHPSVDPPSIRFEHCD